MRAVEAAHRQKEKSRPPRTFLSYILLLLLLSRFGRVRLCATQSLGNVDRWERNMALTGSIYCCSVFCWSGGFSRKNPKCSVGGEMLLELSLSANLKSLSSPSIIQDRTTDNTQVRGWAAGCPSRTSPTWLPSRSLERVSLQPLGPERETQTQRTSVWTLRQGLGGDEMRGWDWHIHTLHRGLLGSPPPNTAVHELVANANTPQSTGDVT